MIKNVIAGVDALTAAFKNLGAAIPGVTGRPRDLDDVIDEALRDKKLPKTTKRLRRELSKR